MTTTKRCKLANMIKRANIEENLEILAPCGSPEAFYAAVNAGADAVYLGVSEFNARAKCDLITLENVGDLIEYAHLFGVKVYITLNTLIGDDEIDRFLSTFDALYKKNADAFIVQDFGMGSLIKRLYPNAVLHASTQMGIHNKEGALFLQKCGYKRVILSRETKLEDIKDIRQSTDLEIEYFVQGALCVAFSGNCYMSALKDGNSGNRGKCHQLCRLSYVCGDKKGYLLSPRDLCLYKNLKLLAEAGVDSIKIEGRLKRPSYVATTVKAYKLALCGADQATVKKDFSDVSITFSRGAYNENAYLFDNDDIINPEQNNHEGVFIGTVKAVKPFKNLTEIDVSSTVPIAVNDGLKFVGKQVVSMGVGTVKKVEKSLYRLITAKSGMSVGDKVYKTLDYDFEQKVLPKQRLLGIDANVVAFSGQPLFITLSANGISVTAEGDILEKAKNSSFSLDDVKSGLKFDKLPFTMRKVCLSTDGVFLPRSSFNATRRKAVSLLKEKIIAHSWTNAQIEVTAKERENAVEYFKTLNKNPISEYLIFDDFKTITEKSSEYLVYRPQDYTDEQAVFDNADIIKNCKNLFLFLPIIAAKDDFSVIKRLLLALDKVSGSAVGVVANNYYGLCFLGKRRTIAGFGLNVYNHVTAGALADSGVFAVTASVERSDMKDLPAHPSKIPLMTLTHCPYKVSAGSTCARCKAQKPLIYKDERGNAYKITRYKLARCYFELSFS